MPVPKQLQPWMRHVKKVREENPKLTYKQVLVKAKKSYKKGGASVHSVMIRFTPIGNAQDAVNVLKGKVNAINRAFTANPEFTERIGDVQYDGRYITVRVTGTDQDSLDYEPYIKDIMKTIKRAMGNTAAIQLDESGFY